MPTESWRLPPLPNDLQSAHREIRALQNLLYKERQILVKNIERRICDNRANAGNLKSVREENAELRRQNKELHKTIKELQNGKTDSSVNSESGS